MSNTACVIVRQTVLAATSGGSLGGWMAHEPLNAVAHSTVRSAGESPGRFAAGWIYFAVR